MYYKNLQYIHMVKMFWKSLCRYKKVDTYQYVPNSNVASSAGEANIAKLIFKMSFYADIKWELPQYGCGL